MIKKNLIFKNFKEMSLNQEAILNSNENRKITNKNITKDDIKENDNIESVEVIEVN